MLKTAPQPVDVQDLQFKLCCRIKVFENAENSNFPKQCNLVATASRFGLIFVGTNTPTIQVIQLKEIEKYVKADGDKADYSRRTIALPSPPSHVSINCEHTILAVIIENNNCPCALFYDVKSFWQQEVLKIGEIRLSPTPGVHVTEVGWNPALASVFTACKSDGTLGIYELKSSGIDINELPAAAGATCFCWSPKGKQIAVGSRDGKITQLKPDLKAVKVINAPPLKEPHTLQSLQWISNYQFIGVFQPINPDSQGVFLVIDAPKTGNPTYINYDDICYSNGSTRPVQYYMLLLPTWNILMAASSNSMEVGILGNAGESWTQWIMGDAARAELPLGANHQDTLPIGCALDIGSTQPVPWGESTLPPAPKLLLFSHHGTLCCFNVINLKPGIPSLCSPPDEIKDASGLHHFKDESKNAATKDPVILAVPAVTKPPVESPKLPVGISSTPSVLFTSQPQVTSSQVLNLSKSQPLNLFGGQATITPLVSGNKPTQAALPPQYSTFFQSLSTNENKNVPASIMQIPASTSASPSMVPKPVVTTAPDLSNIVKLSQPEPKEDPIKTEATNIDLRAEEEAEKIFAQLVKEECVFLESELKAVLHQGKTLKLNLGSDEDKVRIIESTKSLDEFFQEVVESCATQSSEVHILKQNLLQSWAWYEEAKSRYLASEDQSMMILQRAQPLDSASEKQLADIQHTNYYLESQISQAHIALDEQWENFQDYCKKTHKIQIPTMEMIFQTMVKENAIVRKQSYVLKDIANRLKNKSRSALGPSLLVSVDDINNLPDELKKLRMDPEDIFQIQYERVRNRMKNFTKEKAQKLRSFLKGREYSHVTSMKPQMSTSIIQASPASKLKQYSLLSPRITRELPPKKLDFVPATPKSTIPQSETASSFIASTPIEGLQKFALKFENKNFSNVPEKSFAPLKSMIASSPNSAFVSTAFGSNPPSSAGVSSLGKTVPSETAATASVAKVAPSFSVATTLAETDHPVITISTNQLSKPFSFGGSSSLFGASGTNVSKPVFLTTTKPLAFTSESVSTTTAAKPDVKPTASLFNVTVKPTSTNVGLTALTTSANAVSNATVKTPATSGLVFASPSAATSASTFPFSSPSTSIFGGATQKSEPLPTATSKPFSFAPKTTATVASTPSVSKLSSVTTSTTQATTSGDAKATIFSPLATSAFKVGAQAVSASPISVTPATSSLLGALTAPTSMPRPTTTTPAVTSSQLPTFSLGVKPSTPFLATSLATTTTPAVTTSPPVATVTSSVSVSSTIPSTAAAASSTSILGAQTTTSKPSIFGGVSTSTSSPTVSSSAKFGFAEALSNKPSIFGSGEGTKPSIFGNVPSTSPTTGFEVSSTTSSPSSVFAAPSVPTTTTQSSVFGPATSASVFGTSTTAASQPSIFGSTPSTTTSTQSSIFGSTPSVTTATATSTIQSAIFGSTPSVTTASAKSTIQSAIFGSTPSVTTASATSTIQSAIFGGTPSTTTAGFGTSPPTTTASVFGSSTSPTFGGLAATTTQSSLFGSVSSTSSGFGSGTPTTQSSIFGAPTTTATPLFGAAPTTSSSQSIFGAAPNASVFGSTVTSTAPQSIFGSSSATTTSQSQNFGLFGDASQKPSIFGSPVTSSNPVFGNTSQVNQSSIFGNTPNTTASSVFGQSQTPSTFGQSAFGSSSNSFANSSVFGAPTTTFVQPGGSIFGNAPTTASANVFGGTATTGSVFGAPTSSAQSPFGSASVFSPTTQQSSFSPNPSAGASFGFGGLNVGATATTSSSGFGSSPAPNPFENKSVFGNSATPASSSIFGGSPSPSFGAATQNFGSGFGSQPAFAQQGNFGQSSFGTFGQQSTSGPFSSGSSGSVSQSGFGTNSNFQKPAGFGSPPVFGGSPAFGSSPSFGGTPSFGGSPSFGGTSKVFGSSSPGFGGAASSPSAGFGNLANQQTVGFGNLAQQAANSPSGAGFSGNSSFASWR